MSPHRHGRAVAAALAAVLTVPLAAPPAARALETDQFTVLARPLKDSGAAINAKFNLEITRALAELQRPGKPVPTCDVLAAAVRRRLKWQLFQPIELWAVQSPLVDQAPARGEEAHVFTAHSIYRRHGPLDVGMWMPLSPTVEVGGIRFGLDKLAHLVSSGWKYRDAYLRRIRRGESEAAAAAAAVRWGVFEEHGLNGTLVSGVFSRADLEADYQGMRFYLSLCGGPDPILELSGGRWRMRRPFDLRRHLTPEWDESYQVSIYTKSRWRKVAPEIAGVCPLLDAPAVRARFVRYRAGDAVTPTEQVITVLEAEGRLPDSSPYALAAVCPEASTLPPPSGQPPPAPSAAPPGPPVTGEIERAEATRRRRSFLLWRLGWSRAGSLTASGGALFASVPVSDDCRSLCDLRGPTLHASAGLTAGSLTAGWGRVIGETDRRGNALADVYLAYGVRAAVVRTWRNGPLSDPPRTLAGVEGAFTIARVAFTLDLLRSTGAGGRGWVITGGIGLGF